MSSGMGMTRGQAHCLEIVTRYLNEYGIAPSYDELRAELGLKSKSGVHRLVQGLVERGHLFYLKKRARSLSLEPPELVWAKCPHCGENVYARPQKVAA